MALELQDPTYGSPAFVNASGNGTNKWTSLDYGGLTNAAFQGVLLQPSFSNINTDNPTSARSTTEKARCCSTTAWRTTSSRRKGR